MVQLLGAHVSTAGGVAEAPLRGQEIGCNTIQLFAKNNNQWLAKKPFTPQEIDAYQKNIVECGIRCHFSHAGYLINLASPDPKNHELSLASLTQELERADLLGLNFVVLHPGAHVGQGAQKAVQKIAQSINQVFDALSCADTILLLENTAGQGTSIGHCFEELAAILDAVEDKKRIGVCLDTCHLFQGGYDFRTEQGYQKMWNLFDKTVGGSRLKAIHLNDSKKDFGLHVDRHEHIGQGKIGAQGFEFFMQDQRLKNIPMVLETPKEGDPVKFDRMNLEKLQRMGVRALKPSS